ncbi:DNA polymerase III subunit psi [Aliagarivorans marinus]|uniref:DNA polymerase III subunit psi n=1 Tax=Aliagarivorans marinus TaxID=561965 RepID=UPI00041C8F6C|nr:DNA polymerase III subunit psi [Aliagarivorans marinus]
MISRQAQDYLKAMNIDVWLERRPAQLCPDVPLVVLSDAPLNARQQQLADRLTVVLGGAEKATVMAPARLSKDFSGWVLSVDSALGADTGPKLLCASVDEMLEQVEAKRRVWAQLCQS